MTTPTDKTLKLPDPSELQVIQSYGDGGFRISEIRHDGAVLVMPTRTSPWLDASIESLEPALIAGLGVEVLVVGCGLRAAFVQSARRDAFRRQGVALEVGDTSAACRTYNVLLSEGRRVAAVLLPVP